METNWYTITDAVKPLESKPIKQTNPSQNDSIDGFNPFQKTESL
jgi:hypothetical protein